MPENSDRARRKSVAAATPQGIEDVVVTGTSAPDDWAERLISGGMAAPEPPVAAQPSPRRAADPALAQAMKAMRRAFG